MRNLEARLRACFSAVFPDLPEQAVGGATPETVPNWDSLANLSLITVIEEEFGIQIDPEGVDQLTSFPLILGYVRSKVECVSAGEASVLR